MTDEKYRLTRVSLDSDWAAYDEIRSGAHLSTGERVGMDEDDLPDKRSEANHRLLLIHRAEPLGAAHIEYLRGSMVAIRLATISEDRRQEGHGRVLVQLVEDFARAIGARRMVVNATPDTMEFFSRLDYITERWSDPRPSSGNSVQMAKRLKQIDRDVNSSIDRAG